MKEGILIFIDQTYSFIDRLSKKDLFSYNKAIDMDEHLIFAHFYFVVYYSRMVPSTTVDQLSKVVTFDPNNYKALINRGMIHQNLGNYDRALKDIKVMIEKSPKMLLP